MFLSRFAEEISRPIEHDDRIHLDYIPTQVMTEYFRREFHEVHLLGIRYASAQRTRGVCTALFAGAAAVVKGFPGEEDGRWLRLVRRWERGGRLLARSLATLLLAACSSQGTGPQLPDGVGRMAGNDCRCLR